MVETAMEAGASVTRSGFAWEDAEWRFVAFDGTFYGFGRTPEEAAERFLSVNV